MGEMEAQIREVLTPEQQAKYDAKIERMHEEMEKRGGRRHGWDGRPHKERPGD
jgi:Spy/CpxP family protein refolding chaperone